MVHRKNIDTTIDFQKLRINIHDALHKNNIECDLVRHVSLLGFTGEARKNNSERLFRKIQVMVRNSIGCFYDFSSLETSILSRVDWHGHIFRSDVHAMLP